MTSMNDVDIESGKVQVEVFTKTDAALSILREKCATVYDFRTVTGYEQGAELLKEVKGYRTALEKERKKIKAPYLEAGKIIDSEAKRITEVLAELEEPLAAAKKEVDDHKKRMEEQRIARLRSKIQEMESYVDKARNQPSEAVAAMIDTVDAINTQEDFYELKEEAINAQAATLDKLGSIYTDRVQFEQAEKARREAEEKQRAQAAAQRISERINNLRMIPMDLMGKPAAEVRAKLASLRKFTPPANDFGDRLADAQDAQARVIEQLQMMLEQAEQLEAAKAQQDAQRDAEKRAQQEQLQRDIDAAPKQPAPQHAGFEMGNGAGHTVTDVVSSTAVDDQLADDPSAPGVNTLPDSDKLEVGDAIQQHQAQHENIEQALSDLEQAFLDANIELVAESAMVALDAILSGSIRHVSFNGTTSE